jgi:hypothetical protein
MIQGAGNGTLKAPTVLSPVPAFMDWDVTLPWDAGLVECYCAGPLVLRN